MNARHSNATSLRSPGKLLPRHNAVLAMLLWTCCVAVSWWWSFNTYQQRLIELAKVEAVTNINKDLSFRLWATSHGGVYVPPDANTPPNPYLENIPDRDIITDKGKQLTLMNPAYMMRQIMQSYSKLYGVKGHITSLKLTNPNNTPDAWETAALKSFQQGAKETVTIADIDGKPFLRMMRPLLMEKGCLKCHANTGIKEGEIRGGISTAIPMEPLYVAFKPGFVNSSLVHGVVWLLGLGAIGLMAWRTRREADAIDHYQDEINQLNRELEQRVAARTAQLESANKELEGFAYTVSHDLRAPLRAINGFSRLLLEGYRDKLDEEGKRLLNVVVSNAVLMGQLIDAILDYSHLGNAEVSRSEIDMEQMAREVVAKLLPSDVETRLQMEIEHIPPARGDRALLRQVFVNLLTNAIKFSRSNATSRIKVGGYREGSELVYFVKDNGVGFDMQYAEKLFGVFRRLHGVHEFEGTGIGLAIVKRIINLHGGRVWAEGKVNEGAAFYFTLPVSDLTSKMETP